MSGYRETLDVLGRLRGAESEPGGNGPAHASADHRGRRDRALGSISRAPRHRFGTAAMVVVVLAAAAAAAVLLLRGNPKSGPDQPARHSQRKAATTTTTTTLPPVYAPIETAASSATYAPVTPSYVLDVGATTGACWVSVTESSGTTVLAKTFAGGTSGTVRVTGRATIVLGAPTEASLSVGGVRVELPSGMVGPFTVTLDPR